MEYVFSAVLELALTIIKTIFFDSFMPRKKPVLPIAAALICFSVLSMGSSYCLAQWPWAKQIVAVALGMGIAHTVYKTSIMRSAFTSVLFLAISSLVDVGTSYALIAISGMTITQLRAGIATFLIGAGVTHILLLAGSLVLRRVRNIYGGHPALTHIDILRLLVFPIVSAFVLVAMFNSAARTNNTSPLIFASVIGLLAANLALVFIFDQLEREQQIREENKLLQQQIHLETNNIITLMEYHKAQVRIAHDHKNHLHTIATLLGNGDFTEAQAYLGNLAEKYEKAQYVIYTNNPVADAILNLKYLLAKRKKIHMTIDANDLALFPLQSEELATVLINILDNAIEACANVKNRPEITVKMRYNPKESLISVRNTTEKPVFIEDNKVKTSKAHGELHGFGIKNVEAVLLRHGYDYAIGYSDGWFQFTALF